DAMAVAGRQCPAIGVRLDAEIAARSDLHGGEMAPMHVIAVATEILGRELPIAWHDPFVHAADDLDAAFAAIEEGVEVPAHLAEILAQRRRLGIEGGEPEALVIVELRHRHQAPALAV